MRQWFKSMCTRIGTVGKGRSVSRKERQSRPNLEQLEVREVLTGITGAAAFTGGPTYGPTTKINAVNIVSGSSASLISSPISLAFLDFGFNAANAMSGTGSSPSLSSSATQTLTSSINDQLSSLGWSVNPASVTLTIPPMLTAANSELYASVGKFDSAGLVVDANAVELDVIIRGVTGSLTVQVPDAQKIALGATAGAEAGSSFGPIGTVVGGLAGGAAASQISDPTFTFKTDLEITVDLPDPQTLVQDAQSAMGGNILDNANVGLKELNLQVTPQNVPGALVSAVGHFINAIPSSAVTDPKYIPDSLYTDVNLPVAQLAGALQSADPTGTAPYSVGVDQTAQTLNYTVNMASSLKVGDSMSLTPQFDTQMKFVGYGLTVNPSANSSVQIDQVATWTGSGVEATVNGQTVQFLPNKITSINVNTAAGQNTVQILGVPTGVSVNMTAATGSLNNVVVGSNGSLQSILGAVQVNGPAGSTNLSIVDSADSAAHPNAAISQSGVTGLAPGAISYQPSALRSLTIYGGSGASTITVGNTPSTAAATTLYLGSGVDTVNVQATTGALNVTTLPWTAAADTVNVGQNNSVQGITGTVMVSNPLGYTTLNVNDSADAAARSVTISQSGITGLAPAAINYTQSDLQALNIYGGSGASVYTVANTPTSAHVATTLHSGSGANTVNVLATAGALNIIGGGSGQSVNIGQNGSVRGILGAVSVSNPPSYTALTIDDSADAASFPTVTMTSSSISGLAGAPIYYTQGDLLSLTVQGGKGGDLFAINSTPSNYYLSTTVNAGAAGADFRIGGGAQGRLALHGNGNSELDYSTYTGTVEVNLTTGTATAVSGGVSGIREVIGGMGNNLLVGNGLGDVLIGGAGHNLIIDGNSMNQLYGFSLPSYSELVGGTGDNLIIAEGLSYTTNQPALDALFAEWSRTDETAAQRMAHLRYGGGLNGSYELNSSTLASRAYHDTVVGGSSGFNWFLADSTAAIYNQGPNSQVN
jgi:hypothetical protein